MQSIFCLERIPKRDRPQGCNNVYPAYFMSALYKGVE